MFGFSREQQIVVIFLVTAILVGGVVTLIKKHYPEFASDIKTESDGNITLEDESTPETLQQILARSQRLAAQGKTPFTGKVDVNTATESQLTLLPRIGPALAQRIIEYREQHGEFKYVEDLKNVKGIGDATLQRMRPYLTLPARGDNELTTANPTKIDVNTASAEELQLLPGIGPEMAERIINYREEHGRFNTQAELCNVKGIGEKTLAKLSPYLTLPVSTDTSSVKTGSSDVIDDTLAEQNKVTDSLVTSELTSCSVTSKININTADAEQLQSLPIIGPVLASRIIEYRSAHGPFTTIEQIKQVKGISDKTFEKFKNLITVGTDSVSYQDQQLGNVVKEQPDVALPKININTASSDELQKLPQIGPVIAARIIEYRETYGEFRTIEEIKEVKGISEKTFERLKLLITVE